MSRRIWGWLMVLLVATPVIAQHGAEGIDFPAYPQDRIEQLNKFKNLPLRADNSLQPYFPPIIDQLGWSCNQASSVGYLLTYELNRKRELDGSFPENQMSPAFGYNVLMSESPTTGVSYFDTWEILKVHGCSNIIDFPYTSDHKTWPNGYDKYLRALKNKVVNNYSLDVSNSTQLRILKTYLFNHNDNYRYGGLVNLQIASTGMMLAHLPDGSYDAGASVITTFGSQVGHALTVVGFNDEVQYDFNRDGLYTNNLDLNGDGQVTMADWEVGALVVVNSWGKGWGDRGKAYLPYRLLTRYGYEGGIWNRSVHLAEVVHDYEPRLVARVELQHSHRSMVKISVGCSNDPESGFPEVIKEFPMFNYHGGTGSLGMVGEGNHMEIALDISSLMDHVKANQAVKFFLMVTEKDPLGVGSGSIHRFGVNYYPGGEPEVFEVNEEISLLNNQATMVDLSLNLDFNKLSVADYETWYTPSDQWVSIPLQAVGSAGGNLWEIVPDYREDSLVRSFPEPIGEFMPFYTSDDGFLQLELPFSFPFYGENFEQLFADEAGNLYLENEFLDYPYSVDQDLVYRQRKDIVPLGTHLIFSIQGGGITYFASDTLVRIHYTCMVGLDAQAVDYQFCCNLYPDGVIEYHYSDLNLDHPVRLNYQSGLSRGNGSQILTTTPSRLSYLVPNQVVRLSPFKIPPKSKIESNSYLITRPEEENVLFEIRVRVTDKQARQAYGLIPVSTLDLTNSEIAATAWPNPFNQEVNLSFLQRAEGQVKVSVYNLKGQLMAHLFDGELPVGEHHLRWNGKTGAGGVADAGIYLIRILTEDDEQQVKISKFSW